MMEEKFVNRSGRPTMVWKDGNGLVVRVPHMSNEHIVNAISWLVNDPVNDDFTTLFEGHTIAEWIRTLSHELYRRIGE